MIRKSSLSVMLILAAALMLAACGGDGGGDTTSPSASLVTAQSMLPVGDENCPNGGVQLDYGIDENSNGVLDAAEVDGSEYICNGADGAAGTDGQTALINTTALAEGDENCPNGGMKLDYGIDDNANGVLDPSEVDGSENICNGENASAPPAQLQATTISTSRIDLDWSAMAGDPSVVFYNIYMDRGLLNTTADATTTSYPVTPLMPTTVYCFMVTGLDSSYNTVVQSPEVCAVTNGSPNFWQATETVGAPSGREYHTAVWTGSKMIVWGGYYNLNSLDTGGIYDPALNAWSITNTTDASLARHYHTAVWTGTEMIVWGGLSRLVSSNTNTGGQYDPARDAWTATSITGAPSGRAFHTAVSTGSKMIVWGGWDGLSSLNDGGIYDPATNSWTATSTTGAPTARSHHTAVWTGSKMIVWGGVNSGAIYLNDGGIYDSATNSWTAISTAGAPSARRYHTAVWTGSKMIVWGGTAGSDFYLNNGGIYDPATNSWTAISTTGAPSARNEHTAVWTGSKMIVWGGWNGSNALDDGGIYDPAANSWTAISATDAPSARRFHTSVWTGANMVVWGGESLGYSNSGGIYTP